LREEPGATVSAVNLAGLIISLAVMVFLVIALLFPERF